MLEDTVDEHPEDLLAGRGTRDVEHAAARVPAFEPRLGIERHTQVTEIGDPCRRLPDERRGRRSHGTARDPRRIVSSACSSGLSSSPVAAATPPWAR